MPSATYLDSEVVEEAAIAPFSFAKYLMWKDLVDRVGKLEHNRVVRHSSMSDTAFVTDGTGPMPQPHVKWTSASCAWRYRASFAR